MAGEDEQWVRVALCHCKIVKAFVLSFVPSPSKLKPRRTEPALCSALPGHVADGTATSCSLVYMELKPTADGLLHDAFSPSSIHSSF